jgi:mannose-6-phosphate isomerase-like protein (cupin superfamily)
MFVTKEVIDTIFKNKQNGTTCVIKNFCNDVPSWDEFIEYLDEATHQPSSFPDPLPQYDLNLGGKVVGNTLIKQNFYIYIAPHRNIGNSERIIQEFSFIHPWFGIGNLYVNLSSTIDNVPFHSDALDNFYWQCQGSVQWEANGNTYVVEPGDLVFIPAKTSHAVNFSGPRAAVGFSVDLNG